MRDVELSARMQALAQMVSKGSIVCDIGCDHGFVSIYLVQKGVAPKVYAMDVRTGPLERAKEHIKEYGLEAYIETRLSDGLMQLRSGEAECMVCAGMGGPLMMKILTEGREKAQAMKELILQPQSELALFRAFLRKEGYTVVQENMIYEDGKYYPMMKAVPVNNINEAQLGQSESDAVMRKSTERETTDVSDRELWDMFGELLLKEGHPILKQYLEHSQKYMKELLQHLNEQVGERAKLRMEQIREELRMIEKAQAYMKK